MLKDLLQTMLFIDVFGIQLQIQALKRTSLMSVADFITLEIK